MSKPRVGIFGLTGCAGDQLVILNCEDELLDLVGLLDIRDFLMASSANESDTGLDLAIVEGAVVTQRDEQRLIRIRKRARTLMAAGTCAVWGGIAAVDGDEERKQLIERAYAGLGGAYDSRAARAVASVVKVDLSITGCPIEKDQFLRAVASLLNGDAPLGCDHSVCAECKLAENDCLLVSGSAACCGPLTAGGCDARCPTLRIPCVGCRGPAADTNVASALTMFGEMGIPRDEIARKLRTFAPAGAWQ
jgi:coenzyme F420-reducing hydrogenase gamma subunit